MKVEEVADRERCTFHALLEVPSPIEGLMFAFVLGASSMGATLCVCSECLDPLAMAIRRHNRSKGVVT